MDRGVSQSSSIGRTVDQRSSPYLTGDNKMNSLSLSAGSVSAPSLTFSDSKTGLYRPASNEIGVCVSGSQILDIKSSGIVITGDASASGVLSSGSMYLASTSPELAGSGTI